MQQSYDVIHVSWAAKPNKNNVSHYQQKTKIGTELLHWCNCIDIAFPIWPAGVQPIYKPRFSDTSAQTKALMSEMALIKVALALHLSDQ